jgi:hypothetical protein
MIKIIGLILILFAFCSSDGFAQFAGDGSYIWNLTSITYSVNDKTDLVISNKDHYSNQNDHFDYFHFDLIAYHEISKKFTLGLGLRQTESFKSNRWNPGQTYMLYGVYFWHPDNMIVRFANRLASKTYKTSNTQYGLDNITNIDFFVRSTNKLPKPFLMGELFTNINFQKVQTARLYGGFRLIRSKYVGIDIYYCYQKTRPTWEWKNYNVLGVNTKVRI